MSLFYFRLFELMSREYGLNLLESELLEIIYTAQQACWNEIAECGPPDPGKWYLVSDSTGTHFAAYMDGLGFLGSNGEAYEDIITHWAELPFPPGEGA